MLDPRIAVYERALVDEIGVEALVAAAGIDVVNSHFIEAEYIFFAGNSGRLKVPYVVTLHGAYELHNIADADLLAFVRGVDRWVYTAPKNLGHLEDLPIAPERTIGLPNALNIDDGPFPFSRQDFGADADTVIFGIASRAVAEKSWEESIEALRLAQQQTGRRLMLLLCGDGPERERLEPLHSGDEVRFLGFQPNIHGFYRLCDCALLATRYGGESFPLSLVQALQVGTPAIATDVAEIRAMLEADGHLAGVVVPPVNRREALIRSVARAMVEIGDDAFRAARRADAAVLGRRYDLAALAAQYLDIFANAAKW
jgi:glycosyltransferase involved in cell wall biosynthesis